MATLLVNYSSSSEDSPSESDINEYHQPDSAITDEAKKAHDLKRKRTSQNESDIEEKRAAKNDRLPMPDGIKSMFALGEPDRVDKPEEHSGRLRSFPHQRGNWASHVYIPVVEAEHVRNMTQGLITCLRPLAEFQVVDDLHLSLSRTFVLRHHWIEDFVKSLRNGLSSCSGCMLGLQGITFLVNDEKTRTFMVLKACTSIPRLKEYVTHIDSSLIEYRLPVYYDEPSFHISLAWALGDVSSAISPTFTEKLEKEALLFLSEFPQASVLEASSIVCRTGNKEYVIPLDSGS